MPFVWVRWNERDIAHRPYTHKILWKLTGELPTIVAEALSVPGTDGELKPKGLSKKD